MNLESQINDQIKVAMRAKESATLRSLRAIKSEILKEKTKAGGSGDVSEDNAMKILMKMAKQRRDSIDIFREQNREDLAVKEEEELKVIAKFLPEQMSEAEVKEKVQGIIEKVGAGSPKEIGKVMGVAMKELAGKADGKLISKLAKELLS